MNLSDRFKINTSVEIGGLKLKNPVMTASGTFGYGEEYAAHVDLNKLGAIVVKGLSLEPRRGNQPPRIMETCGGMLNSIGLENPSVEEFVINKLPFLRHYDLPVIVNIFGETIEDYRRISEILNHAEGVHALEVNISCPNVEKGGLSFGADPDSANEVTKIVKNNSRYPVIVKLTPNVTDICLIAEAVQDGGADAVCLINTVLGMSVDVERRIPNLKRVVGGLSGPAIKPIALRMVWQVVKRLKIPVIGVGGIMDARDAMEFLIVGATAIQVGTANFVNPRATIEIIEGIEEYMNKHRIGDIKDLIGTLKE